MGIIYVGSSAVSAGGTGEAGGQTIFDAQTGDFAIMQLYNATTRYVTGVGGSWIPVGGVYRHYNGGVGGSSCIVYKTLGAVGETTPTITCSVAGALKGGMVWTFRGVKAIADGGPFDPAYPGQQNSNPSSAGPRTSGHAVTTTEDGACVVETIHQNAYDTNFSLSTPNGFSLGGQIDTAGSNGQESTIAACYGVKATAGAVTMPEWSWSPNTNYYHRFVTFVLAPAPAEVLGSLALTGIGRFSPRLRILPNSYWQPPRHLVWVYGLDGVRKNVID